MAAVGELSGAGSEPLILHIFVVGFHHQKGSTVEFVYPPLVPSSSSEPRSITSSLPPEWKNLPHLALPDGCHNYEEDSSLFILPQARDAQEPSIQSGNYVYGIACCRQIDTKDLPQQGADVTRSTVQKSICVLSHLPLFGFIEAKLQLVTHAYFNSKNFSDVSILRDAYRDFNASLSPGSATSVLYVGISPREQVLLYQHRLLQVFKALLLQKRVIVFGSPVRKLCCSVIAVGSLFPQCYEAWTDRSDVHADDEFGLPLRVFETGSIQPYFCLQQIDMVARKRREGEPGRSWLLGGVVNPLFEKQHQKLCDVFVNMKDGAVAIADPDLRSALHLTTADLRFCSVLTDEIHEEGETGYERSQWVGSSGWVQAQFKHYTLSLLATSLSGDATAVGDFNEEFMTTWLQSPVYLGWKQRTERGEITRIDPHHVCHGELSVSDLKRRLVAQASDYGLLNVHQREQVTHAVEKTQKVIAETAEKVTGAVSGVWSAASSAVYAWWWTSEDGGEEDANNDDK